MESNLKKKHILQFLWHFKKILFFSIFLLCFFEKTACAECLEKDNIPLKLSMSLLKQASNVQSAHALSIALSNMLDMDLFLKNALPSEMLLEATAEDKKQLKYFLNNAIVKTLENYFSNPSLGPNVFRPLICQDSKDQYVIIIRYDKHGLPVPFVLSFYRSDKWAINDIAIYTTFLSAGYVFQFKNWLLKQSFPQIMMSIRNQNVILQKNKSSAR